MKDHDERLASYLDHMDRPSVFWRGMAMRWDHEGPILSTVHVDDWAEFQDGFGVPICDKRAEGVCCDMPRELVDAAEYQAREWARLHKAERFAE